MNCVFGKRVNQGGMIILTLTVLALTAGISVPLQADSDNVQTSLISHNSWSKGAPMPKTLKFAMTGVIGGKVYVVGGATNTAVVTNNQVYNPVTNTWRSKAALPVATADGLALLRFHAADTKCLTVSDHCWGSFLRAATSSGQVSER